MIMDLNQITIIKRDVKYPRIELKTNVPILILPKTDYFEPEAILNKHRKWLKQKLEFVKNIKNKYKNQRIYLRNEKELINLVENSVKRYSVTLKRKPTKIMFRYMRTKWGSCSKKGRITFNLILKYVAPSIIYYIVFHEMMHLIIPKHNEKFWLRIGQEFKNYKKHEETLFGYWFLINSQKIKTQTSIV